MPKKTKKEKLLAQQHRTNLPLIVPVPATPIGTENTPSFRLTLPDRTPVIAHPLAASIDEFTAIQRDLKKTLLITVSIIASEFLLAHYLPH